MSSNIKFSSLKYPFLIMSDNSAIPVSRNKKEEILLMFKGEV